MNNTVVCVLFLYISFFLIDSVCAEDVSNYSGCDVCHGAIHFTPDETAGFLGKKEFTRLLEEANTDPNRVVKLDLDGILKNGNNQSPDEGYELKIWGNNSVFIKSLIDGSLIQILLQQGGIDIQAHVYVEASSFYEIDLKDPVDTAWKKLEHSNIFQWVGQTGDRQLWKTFLGEKILFAIKLLKINN